MIEEDYISATDLAKFRMALLILNEITGLTPAAEAAAHVAKKAVRDGIAALEPLVSQEEDDEDES